MSILQYIYSYIIVFCVKMIDTIYYNMYHVDKEIRLLFQCILHIQHIMWLKNIHAQVNDANLIILCISHFLDYDDYCIIWLQYLRFLLVVQYVSYFLHCTHLVQYCYFMMVCFDIFVLHVLLFLSCATASLNTSPSTPTSKAQSPTAKILLPPSGNTCHQNE